MNIISQRKLEKKVPFIAPDCSTIFVRRAQIKPKESLEKKKIKEEPLNEQSFSTDDNSLTTTIEDFFKNSNEVKMQESGEELGYRSSSSISESGDAPDAAAKICNECESKNKTIQDLNKEIDQIAEETKKSLLGVMELDEELINQLKENNSTYKAANQSLQLENQKLFKENESEKEANHSLQLQVESLKIKLDEANLKLFDAEEQIPQMNDNENTEEVFRLTKKVESLEDKLAHRKSPDGVKQLKDSITIYEQRVVKDGEKIKMLEKENDQLRNNLDVDSFLLPPIEESKLAIYPIAQENDTLKVQVKMDKEKIENLEKENERLRDDLNLSEKFLPDSGIEESKIACVDCVRWGSLAINYIEKIENLEIENERLRNDLDISSSEKLLPDSGIEESKLVLLPITEENEALKAEAEKDKAEIELLKVQVNFLKKDAMADQVVKLSSTNKLLIDENFRLKKKVEQHEFSEENANQNLEHHMYDYRKQLNLDVTEFEETQVKVIQFEKENQKLKAKCDQILQDKEQISAKFRENVDRKRELAQLNLNLKTENQKLKAQCDQISQDRQQISAKFRENVDRMRQMEELNFTLKSECDQYLEFSESAIEDQEISDYDLKVKENFIKELEKRLKEMDEKNPNDCISKICENEKNDLNGRIAEGFLELQEVHKQFKIEVDGLKVKLQAVDENMTQKLVKSQSDQISQDKQQFSENLHEKVKRMRKLEELNLNLKAENKKLKAQCDLDSGWVTIQEKQDDSEEVFSNDDAKICNDCESKNQAIENLENEVMEMKMKLEVQGLFFDPNDPTLTKWISPIFKLAPILEKILSIHVPRPLAITYGTTLPKNGLQEVAGSQQPAQIANFFEMWQKFMEFCQQQNNK